MDKERRKSREDPDSVESAFDSKADRQKDWYTDE